VIREVEREIAFILKQWELKLTEEALMEGKKRP